MRRRELVVSLGFGAFARLPPALAQQKTVPVIGVLAEVGLPGSGFTNGLKDNGYIQNENVAIEERRATGRPDELPEMAAGFVHRRVNVIAANGSDAALAAKRASSTLPIVFVSGEPVAEGLVTSLARPGANLTGVSLMYGELTAKRLELLSELVPQATIFALLVNPITSSAATTIKAAQEAARSRRLELHILKASTIGEIDSAFETLPQIHAQALLVDPDPFLTSQSSYLVNIAARHAIPAIYAVDDLAWSGGLISYGADSQDVFRLMGNYVGRVLKGERPADLPVQQPTKFELIVNLETARALGLTVPQSIRALADEVIE
jgi:putative tryptophan/tyrosine transport system substrate-binding protein